ncbi:MAG: PaaI family thioesterase [Ideonella sp.]|nr:MAG: PaaI family thioesterase [Burkholderiaceae bacterium]MBE7425355.1 PaaI family thioesterase [Ideonella sp.]
MATDLDLARAIFASAPFMVELGVVPTAIGAGTVATELRVEKRHTQHTGVVHAGVMATMADHSMGAAAQSLAPAGHWVLTAELKTSLLRPALGERLVCEAQVLKPGRAITFTEAQVWAVSGQQRTLVMKASATMAITAPKT